MTARRTVILSHNRVNQKIEVYSNRKKAFAKFQNEFGKSYLTFCREVASGINIEIIGDFGLMEKIRIVSKVLK